MFTESVELAISLYNLHASINVGFNEMISILQKVDTKVKKFNLGFIL